MLLSKRGGIGRLCGVLFSLSLALGLDFDVVTRADGLTEEALVGQLLVDVVEHLLVLGLLLVDLVAKLNKPGMVFVSAIAISAENSFLLLAVDLGERVLVLFVNKLREGLGVEFCVG